MTTKKMAAPIAAEATEKKPVKKQGTKSTKKRTASKPCPVVEKCPKSCNNCDQLGYIRQRFEIQLKGDLARELKAAFISQKVSGETIERFIARKLSESL